MLSVVINERPVRPRWLRGRLAGRLLLRAAALPLPLVYDALQTLRGWPKKSPARRCKRRPCSTRRTRKAKRRRGCLSPSPALRRS